MATNYTWKNAEQLPDNGSEPEALRKGIREVEYVHHNFFSMHDHLNIRVTGESPQEIKETTTKILNCIADRVDGQTTDLIPEVIPVEINNVTIKLSRITPDQVKMLIGFLVENAWLNNDVQAEMLQDFEKNQKRDSGRGL